jgi:hypothetical protein
MYSSLTSEQEILGKAATDKDDGVKAEPGDNDHQDNDNNDDDNNDGDWGGGCWVRRWVSIWSAIGMPPIMGLGSPTHPDDEDDGLLPFADLLGDVSGEC